MATTTTLLPPAEIEEKPSSSRPPVHTMTTRSRSRIDSERPRTPTHEDLATTFKRIIQAAEDEEIPRQKFWPRTPRKSEEEGGPLIDLESHESWRGEPLEDYDQDVSYGREAGNPPIDPTFDQQQDTLLEEELQQEEEGEEKQPTPFRMDDEEHKQDEYDRAIEQARAHQRTISDIRFDLTKLKTEKKAKELAYLNFGNQMIEREIEELKRYVEATQPTYDRPPKEKSEPRRKSKVDKGKQRDPGPFEPKQPQPRDHKDGDPGDDQGKPDPKDGDPSKGHGSGGPGDDPDRDPDHDPNNDPDGGGPEGPDNGYDADRSENTAEEELRQRRRPHTDVKLPQPKTFNGHEPPVAQWLFTLAYYYDAMSIPKEDRITYTVLMLTGHAMAWCSTLCQKNEQPRDWNYFRRIIIEKFQPIDEERRARDELSKLRQTDTVFDYITKFEMLTFRIPSLNDTEAFYTFRRGNEK